MKKNSSQYVFFFILLITIYIIFTVLLYFYSLKIGNKGVNVTLFGGGDDGIFYYDQAINFAHGLPYEVTSIQVVIYGIIFKIFNTENALFLRLFNYFGFLMITTISLLLLKKIIPMKNNFFQAGTLLIILLMLYPSLILNINLSLYRDVWIYFFFLWCMFLFSNVFIIKAKYPRIINFIFLLFSMSMLFGFRKYALLSFLIGSFIYIVLSRNIKLKRAFVYLLVGFTLFYIFMKDLKVPIVNLSFSDVLAYRQSFINEYAGGSQMNITLEQPNIVLFYLNYLYSLFSNVIGPFPWQVNGLATLLLLVTEGTVFIIILAVLLKSRRAFTNIEKYILIQSIVWFMLISISNDNFGAGSRLRIVGWLPLLILFSKYYVELKILKKRRDQQNL